MKKQMIACDCGFTVQTPHGENELVEVAMAHVKRVHPGMNVTREQAKSMIKPV